MICPNGWRELGIGEPLEFGDIYWDPLDGWQLLPERKHAVFTSGFFRRLPRPVPLWDSISDFARRQRAFSLKTFGPGERVSQITDHLGKELKEISDKPSDIEEWVDFAIIAIDGMLRQGYSGEDIGLALNDKLSKNIWREWPDWRTSDASKAICHIAETETPSGVACHLSSYYTDEPGCPKEIRCKECGDFLNFVTGKRHP